MQTPKQKGDTSHTEQFVRLFADNEQQIFKYIFALLPSPEDARDVFQNTSVVLWRKFDQFEPGSRFVAWACQIARYEVLDFRKQQSRDRIRLLVDDGLFEQIAEERISQTAVPVDRQRALIDCLAKLDQRDRELIQRRYGGTETIKQLSEDWGRPTNTLYNALQRVRRTLLQCVRHNLTEGTV